MLVVLTYTRSQCLNSTWTYLTGGLMMTCEQVETCSLYNLNKYLLCWHIPEPSILIAPWTYFTGGLMMTCEQVETCSLYNLNKCLLCWHIPDPSILTASWTYLTGGLMMTYEQVETCSLYTSNKCLLCWRIRVTLLYTSSEHFVMPSLKFPNIYFRNILQQMPISGRYQAYVFVGSVTGLNGLCCSS